MRKKWILSKLREVHDNTNSRFSSALPTASKTHRSLTGEMKQENAKQLVQAYATDEKQKQHTDLQAPSLCPTILSF